MTRYPVAIYLNQKVVFDLLAIIEDGFSEVRKLETDQYSELKRGIDVQGEIGVSNVFSLLGVKLKSALGQNNTSTERTHQIEEKVHTPTSLFARFQNYLYEKSLIKEITYSKDIDKTSTGDFVLFKGKLQTSPVLSLLDSFEQLGVMITRFDNYSRGKTKKNTQEDNSKILKQIKAMKDGLMSNGMLDLICTLEDGTKAVMPVYSNYFFNNNMNEIIDGEFTILGKIVKKVVGDNDDNISLLRNTSFKIFDEYMFDEMFDHMSDLPEGIKIPKANTVIEAPSMLVLPISIYS